MRIPVTGRNDQALQAPGSGQREVISGLDIDGVGMTFCLRWLLIANEGTTAAVVEITDQDEAAITAANQRFTVHVAPGDTAMVEFPDPGFKFVTNVTAGTTGGTIATLGGISGGGYLE